MIIVAFGHRSRVGKDTSAKLLETALRLRGVKTKKVSFAGKLKQAAHVVFGWAGLQDANYYETEEGAAARQVKLPIIDKTPVEIWVEFGNKIREIFPDTWVNSVLLTEYPKVDVLIVTDLRFPNEGDKINDLDGITVWVRRPDVPLLDTVSDKALVGWDGWKVELDNDGTLRDLNGKILDLANLVHGRMSDG